MKTALEIKETTRKENLKYNNNKKKKKKNNELNYNEIRH